MHSFKFFLGLFLVSDDDDISDPELNRKLIHSWRERGIRVRTKCWSNSKHVMHSHIHSDEYERELDVFLNELHML